jgi:aminoglycoside phosphotransferase (APT) family kinase protein
LKLERLGAGREAEIFAWGDGRVLRLARDAWRRPSVEREAIALGAAYRAGVPVPAVYELVTIDERPGAVLDRIDGEDLLVHLGRRPWALWSVAKTLGRQHAALHRVDAPEALPPLREELRRRLHSELVPDDVREHALILLDQLPDGERLCHGDFHPGNLLRAGSGYVVIDWTNAARGHPSADVARSLLLLATAAIPSDAPAAVRRLATGGRRFLVAAYLRAYAREMPLDRELVDRWRPVCIAARLSEDIEEERVDLLALARASRFENA